MKNLISISRYFYGIGIIGIGIQHVLYANFRPVILPPWPAFLHGPAVWAYLAGLGLVVSGALIVFNKKSGSAALVLGGVLFLLFIGFQAPYQFFIIPYSLHLGLWTDALKELALSGGAFVVAGSLTEEAATDEPNSFPFPLLEKMIPLGKIFFSITMISFGIDHFLYTESISTLVPAWIPGPIFWTYFAAVALIGSGVGINLKMTAKPVGLLLGIMLFLWLILLHIPRAIAYPYVAEGNEITSVFEDLAFSGIAFIIASTQKK